MYESPITILKAETYKEIDELIKALNYDRDQYAKGYIEAIDDAINAINNYIASEVCDFYDQYGCMECIRILKDLKKEE